MEPSTGPQDEVAVSGAVVASDSRTGLGPLIGCFLKLGTVGFGGPVALVGFMHRDLVERRGWITEDTYKLSLALAQIMPGPLAAQTAIAIGYFEGGVLGATLAGLAFIIPSFLMVVGISLAYVAYGGLWWMQALFYAIGATVIANHRHCGLQARAAPTSATRCFGRFSVFLRRLQYGHSPSWRSSLFLLV
jgi:chromate transporter